MPRKRKDADAAPAAGDDAVAWLHGLLKQLGWTVSELGRRSGHGVPAASDWARGRITVPAEVEAWLTAYAAARRELDKRHPPPAKVDRRLKRPRRRGA